MRACHCLHVSRPTLLVRFTMPGAFPSPHIALTLRPRRDSASFDLHGVQPTPRALRVKTKLHEPRIEQNQSRQRSSLPAPTNVSERECATQQQHFIRAQDRGHSTALRKPLKEIRGICGGGFCAMRQLTWRGVVHESSRSLFCSLVTHQQTRPANSTNHDHSQRKDLCTRKALI